MRYLLAIVAFMVVFGDTSFAQTEFTREYNNYRMGVGPVLGYKLGVNAADTQDGVKNGLGTAGMPDFGASLYIPLDPESKMGLIVDAMYANYPYLQKFDGSSVDWTDRFNYFALGANFYISNFTIGLNMGIPLGGNRVYSDREVEIQSSSMSTMYEFRIGGNFTLNESNVGRFILFVNAGYQINGQYTDEVNMGSYNPHPASLQLGLSYLINVE